ncbi:MULTISPECIES: GNAT family N-acetyltransferase [Pseudomonas syringae group]|uniref:GNAT family N-acetyltransferase n=1 Tax=Pseudomonas syringae group TaxID=136849 RepID=UPI0010FA7144|nr:MULTISPECIES: N-acetyltransferase [Pseudomonas syringae group]MBI6742698.1 GNAT family N-acetyltransferase [Pseudomonas syringae]MBI6747812.1 GNAT family N-acetyltransferase [Pseudomonas syringae]MBI6761882.1 GNAT family N-acetyltransferase [Pseudomonas syringae]MBI6764113.1 GNAT family N-acetyltransferase [Pseudomonas syringae]MBI6788922.1 GNAT family N-acetyltransferase [Pseudomonas syringae]
MIQIRPMTPEDFERFWPTFQAVVIAQETYAYDPALTQEQARDLWMKAPLHTLIAEEDGQLLGSYYLKANAAGPGNHVCNCGYMVTDAARGRGVARLMCEHSQQLARDSRFLAMQFNSVVASNEVAVGLWSKLGFETVGRLPKAYRHARLGLVDCLVMYKWLADEPVAKEPAQPKLIGRKNIESVVSRPRRK